MGVHLGRHPWAANGWQQYLVAVALILSFIILTEVPVAAGASHNTCRVKNASTARTSSHLQLAVKAAKPGAHLVIKGTCQGGTFIDKDLDLRGVETRRTGEAILDGMDKARVLTVRPGIEVTIHDVVIQGGLATRVPRGGGILNRGRLTLRDVIARDNRAAQGGGVYNLGVLRLFGRSGIVHNEATVSGGGLSNGGICVLNDMSRVSRNSVSGGVSASWGVENWGGLTLNDSSVVRKNAGGVGNSGGLTLNDSSSITGNTGVRGAGVFNTGSLALNGRSRISGNCAELDGGGVYNGFTMELNGSSEITGNHAGHQGGGVWNWATLTMSASSSIRENTAGFQGGGLFHWGMGATRNGVNCAPHTYANVYGNTPDDCQLLASQ